MQSRDVINRLVRLANTKASRPVDANWQIAVAIAQREATEHSFRKVMSRDITRALRYVKHCLRKGKPDPGKFADVHCAWLLRYKADRLRRTTLEARLLTEQTIAETAAACKLPVEIVRLYASLFFCVSDKLKHSIYIIGEAIGPRYWTGFGEDEIDIVIKHMTYIKGPMFLDYILPYFTTPWSIPNRLDRLSAAELTNLQKMISIRATIEAMTMSPRRVLVEFSRCSTTEPSTQWQALAQELQVLATAASDREIEQRRLIANVTNLSMTSMTRLMETYREAPTAPVSRGESPEPVLLAG